MCGIVVFLFNIHLRISYSNWQGAPRMGVSQMGGYGYRGAQGAPGGPPSGAPRYPGIQFSVVV